MELLPGLEPGYHQYRLESDLVESYQRQLGEPPVPTREEVHTIYEACRQDIAVLWATDDGKRQLFPMLVGRENIKGGILDKRRADVTARLAILFEPLVTIESVAEEQGIQGGRVRQTLHDTFRQLAVVQRRSPELFDGPVVAFSREHAWPAFTESLEGQAENNS